MNETIITRLDNYDNLKNIYRVLAKIHFFDYLTKNGFEIEKLLSDLTGELINEICAAITGELKSWSFWEFLEVFSDFLSSIAVKTASMPSFARILGVVTGYDLTKIAALLTLSTTSPES